MKCFFNLLGWAVDWGSSKDLPFAAIFCALGVEFRLDRLSQHVVVIANKKSRIEALCRLVKETMASSYISAELAAEVAGKFQYA
jgi:hypothetical protein